MREKRIPPEYLRSFIFGVEDSLVSTVGLLSGIAIAGVQKETILLTGIILVLVEAFSMAAGNFLSEHSVQDYLLRRESKNKRSFLTGVIMFFSYFFSGFVPLLPYLFFEHLTALSMSIIFSLLALFALGAVGAKLAKVDMTRSGFRMFFVGGIAIFAGVVAGLFLPH